MIYVLTDVILRVILGLQVIVFTLFFSIVVIAFTFNIPVMNGCRFSSVTILLLAAGLCLGLTMF